jgi:hypothetical protein
VHFLGYQTSGRRTQPPEDCIWGTVLGALYFAVIIDEQRYFMPHAVSPALEPSAVPSHMYRVLPLQPSTVARGHLAAAACNSEIDAAVLL